jgi:glycosyltransferase involved in cell wall biosynthesis
MSCLVSVIIPCFNQARFLPEAVESVLLQTHSETEIIIINDGSSDDTERVAKSFGDRVSYARIEHSGPSRPRNTGLELATGRYIQFLDADDVLLPTKIASQLAQFTNPEELNVAYCEYYFGKLEAVREPSPAIARRLPARLNHDRVLLDMAHRWETELTIPIHSFLFDARIFKDHGIRLDESLPNHVDWDCWLRIARLPTRWHYLEEQLAIYRLNPTSLTRNHRRMRDGFVAAIDKHLRLAKREPELRDILLWKRDETLFRYDRAIARGVPKPWSGLYSLARKCYRRGSGALLRARALF